VGTSVACDNRLATSVQTHFFRYRQCGSCRQARALDAAPLRLARQRGEERWRTSRAAVARGEGAGCAEHRTGEATYARGRKCENALELRGKRAPAEFPGQAIARESTLAQGDGVLGALGCTQRTRGSRRVGNALEWLGGATCTVEETCARDSAQAAGVCSQHAWCGGEGDGASKRAGSSAEEARICVEERAFRAR